MIHDVKRQVFVQTSIPRRWESLIFHDMHFDAKSKLENICWARIYDRAVTSHETYNTATAAAEEKTTMITKRQFLPLRN